MKNKISVSIEFYIMNVIKLGFWKDVRGRDKCDPIQEDMPKINSSEYLDGFADKVKSVESIMTKYIFRQFHRAEDNTSSDTVQVYLTNPHDILHFPNCQQYVPSYMIQQLNNYAPPFDYTNYDGTSYCRVCGIDNGSAEITLGGPQKYQFPIGYFHYIIDHQIEVPLDFQETILNANITEECLNIPKDLLCLCNQLFSELNYKAMCHGIANITYSN